jgi:hypothetical protein
MPGPTTIFFNGRLISIPGAYSEVDASGLEQVGLGASGIVGVIGTAEGGKSVNDITEPDDFIRCDRPEKVRTEFRSGDLYEVGDMLFAPGRDPDILAGAQELVMMKVNPATAGTATFANAIGNAMTVTSEDYGAFVNQINVSIANGTNLGKLLTIVFEDVTETVDDLGGTNILTLTYVTGTNGWGNGAGSVCTAQVLSGGDIQALATRTNVGIDGDITDGLVGVMSYVSDSASDTQQITVYGHDASDLPVSETVTLTGVTPVTGTQAFKAASVWGARLSSAAVGSITVSDTNPTVLITLTVGETSQGMILGTAMFVSGGVISLVSSGASVKEVILAGKDVSGATQLERRTLKGTTATIGQAVSGTVTWDGTTTVLTTVTTQLAVGNWISMDSDAQAFKITAITAGTSVTIENPRGLTIPTGAAASSYALGWSEITGVVLGDVEAAQTITISAEIGFSDKTVQTTIKKVEDYFDARSVTISSVTYGFICALVSGETTFSVANLDVMSATTSIKDTVYGVLANLYAIVNWINENSNYITAVAASGAQDGFPTNTTAPVFLSGGSEGTATAALWQTALNLLKQVRVNSIVVLTGNAAVHAMVDAHCAYMGGVGRSERDGFVGLLNAAEDDVPLKSEVKSQIVALNSRHIRAFGQAIDRYNTVGTRTEFLPMFQAAIAAGMQAGSEVGTSLTFKYTNILSFRQSTGATGWNPTDDAEEMIKAGLCFVENVEGVGNRFVRNNTTHLSTSNIAYTEGSVNEATNYSVYNLRTSLEAVVGKKGFAGTINSAMSVARNILALLVGEEALVAYRSLAAELIVDVMEVSVEIAPVIPINFVKTSVHLVTIRQEA